MENPFFPEGSAISREFQGCPKQLLLPGNAEFRFFFWFFLIGKALLGTIPAFQRHQVALALLLGKIPLNWDWQPQGEQQLQEKLGINRNYWE